MDVGQVYEQYVRPLSPSDRLHLAERIMAQAATEANEAQGAPRPEPLGDRLRAIRARIEQSGEPLLDEDGMRKELAERRGGVEAREQAGHENLR